MKIDKINIVSFGAIAVVLILHLVGLFGLRSAYVANFEALTPLNLLITFLILYTFHEGSRKKQFYFFLLAFSVGMIAEILGVQTGFPFGTYHYTKLLSISILGVPLLIGANWFMLSYGLIALLNRLLDKASLLLKSTLAAFFMTFMDVLIEPFAIKHSLWVWSNNQVPFENYFSWFIISFFLFIWGFKILPTEKNNVAISVLCILIGFFGLNILLN